MFSPAKRAAASASVILNNGTIYGLLINGCGITRIISSFNSATAHRV